MCGVVALFARDGRAISRPALERAVGALHHRGPDGNGHWLSPSGAVGLGHARLSIVDLEGGAQPIASEDESLHVVVNGEIYDDDLLRARLQRAGHRFRTRSDSEVLVHLYEDEGTACVASLRGELAALLWDERRQTLLAIRDRFGIKPLYYTSIGETILFASEIKALVAAGAAVRWAPASLLGFGALQSMLPGRTPFAGIHQVPPGHMMVCTRERLELVRYWDLAFAPRAPAGPPSAGADEDYAAALRALLDEAVRVRLRADVPVACYLSGGIDSSGVLALAQRHAARPIQTFTISFDSPEYDEAAAAAETAAFLGAPHHLVPVTAADLADNFARAVWHSETLFANLHGVAKFMLSRATRDAGYKVVLTGEGADEVFAGYSGFVRDMLLHNPEGQSADEVTRLRAKMERQERMAAQLSLPPGTSLVVDAIRRTLGFVPGWVQERQGTAATFERLLSPDAVLLDDELRAALDVDERMRGRDPVNQSLYLWSKTFLPSYVLNVLGDRMEMAHSIEGRVPFLDHQVVEWASALPIAQKLRGGVEKHVLRKALEPLLPRAVTRRPKHAFAAPPLALLGNARVVDLMNDMLRGSRLQALPFVDQRRVVELLDGLDGMESHARVELEPVLIGLLSACALHQQLGASA